MRILIFLCITIVLTSCTRAQESVYSDSENETSSLLKDTIAVHNRLMEKAQKMRSFVRNNSIYNQHYAFLLDMRVPSGNFRFFIVDIDSMKVLSKGLVAHGSGSETGIQDSLRFSNIPESYCTSLGKYKIGSSYAGSFGRSYKLHGLESSNNNAFARSIVLHRYLCVPDEEQEYEICNSLGCAMISENYFEEMEKWIQKSKKPILMEIYY